MDATTLASTPEEDEKKHDTVQDGTGDGDENEEALRQMLTEHCTTILAPLTKAEAKKLGTDGVRKRLRKLIDKALIKKHRRLIKTIVRAVRHQSSDDEEEEKDEMEGARTRRRREKKKKQQHDKAAKANEPPSYFDTIVASLKRKRQIHSSLTSKEQREREDDFLRRMDEAASADAAADVETSHPMARLSMLDEVQHQLKKRYEVVEQLLESGLLRRVSAWLEPETDGSLPNVRIRTVLYAALGTMPIHEELLRNSNGLGKRLMKNWASADETDANKRVLHALLEKWMRPILGASTDYAANLAEADEDRQHEILIRRERQEASQQRTKAKAPTSRLVQRPQAAYFDYAIRPSSTARDGDEEDENADGGNDEAEEQPSKRRKRELDSSRQRMETHLNKAAAAFSSASAGKPKFKVDVNGRNALL
jgi:hypothetical protein